MFLNEVNTSMALAFWLMLFVWRHRQEKKKGKQKANQKWRISERLHFSASLVDLIFLKTESWVLF